MTRIRADLSRPTGRHPLGGAGPRVRRRRRGQRLRARHQRRRRVAGPDRVFDGVDYVALGHLHGRHTLSDRIRYSGSPLAYSFSEADHLKGSWLVDLDGDGTATAEFVEAPVPRPLARLRGDLESLLTDARHNRHEASYVQVTLTDADRPPQAMERLRTRFPLTLVLAFEPAGRGARPPAPGAGRADGATTTSPSTSSPTCAARRPARPSPCSCATPWTRAATTPSATCWSAARPPA